MNTTPNKDQYQNIAQKLAIEIIDLGVAMTHPGGGYPRKSVEAISAIIADHDAELLTESRIHAEAQESEGEGPWICFNCGFR